MIPNQYVLLFIFALLIIAFATCNKCRDTNNKSRNTDEEEVVNSTLPILWIHVPFEYNARHWASFGSRSSTDINQPYFELTLRSIIKNCDDSFKICLIDDGSFEKLIPNWSVKLNKLSDPVLPYVRQLGILQLLHRYGGMVVPPSFLCFKDLMPLYEKGLSNTSMFVGENVNTNVTSNEFSPDIHFMGAVKESPVIENFIEFLRRTISTDYTAQPDFNGEFSQWIINHASSISIIPGNMLGTQTSNGAPVLVDNLLSQTPISFYSGAYGIWIPSNDILKRRHYEWFSRMDAQQIFDSDCTLCKYFVLATAPDSKVESMEQRPNWVSFWKTPRASVWGLKPIYLGNNVPREKNPNFA
jgi:hypothetical protein